MRSIMLYFALLMFVFVSCGCNSVNQEAKDNINLADATNGFENPDNTDSNSYFISNNNTFNVTDDCNGEAMQDEINPNIPYTSETMETIDQNLCTYSDESACYSTVCEGSLIGDKSDKDIISNFINNEIVLSQEGKGTEQIIDELLSQNVLCFFVMFRADLFEIVSCIGDDYIIDHMVFDNCDELELFFNKTYTADYCDYILANNDADRMKPYYNMEGHIVWNPSVAPLFYPFYPFQYGYSYEILSETSDICKFVCYYSALKCDGPNPDDWSLVKYGQECTAVRECGEWRLTEIIYGGIVPDN